MGVSRVADHCSVISGRCQIYETQECGWASRLHYDVSKNREFTADLRKISGDQGTTTKSNGLQ